MRNCFSLYKGEHVCYRLRLILVLHYTMFRFDIIQYVDRIKVTERKMMNLFPSNSGIVNINILVGNP